MANVSTSIQRLSVDFLENTTEVYLFIESSEPDNPFWGDGCRHKSYPKEKSLQDILPDVTDYLDWEIVCPTCKKVDKPIAETDKFCADVYHVDQGSNLLGIFDEKVEV